MYGMLIFVVVTVFIAGLMVGRTPEYLGKKVEAYDVQMAMLYLLIFPLVILGFTAVSVLAPLGCRASRTMGRMGCRRFCMRTRRRRQQRIGVRGVECEHALVQLDAGTHDAGGAFHDDHSDAGGCGQPGDKEDRAAERWARSR